jgi:hypothetical protein
VAQEEVGPATTIKVQVINTDLNRDPYSVQSTFCNINVTSSTGVQKAFLDVYETGADTSIFEGKIHLNPLQTMPSQYNNNLTIKALPDDLVHISYDGVTGMDGQVAIEADTVKVISTDPKMRFDTDYYLHFVNTITVLLDDPDANRDPDKIDVLPLYATSTSDSLHHEVQGFETGPNTGEFRADVKTSETYSIGKLKMQYGDNIAVEYEDRFPKAFSKKFIDTGGVLDKSTQKFPVNAVLGVECACESMTPTAPRLIDLGGLALSSAPAGQQVVVAINLDNDNAKDVPFVGIIEVRDEDGITTMLRWQTGVLGPNSGLDVAASWVPETPGNYEVRSFVVSNLSNPQILSEVVASMFTIS